LKQYDKMQLPPLLLVFEETKGDLEVGEDAESINDHKEPFTTSCK
jgi:hypothetical protein